MAKARNKGVAALIPFPELLKSANGVLSQYLTYRREAVKSKLELAQIRAEVKMYVAQVVATRKIVMEYLKRSYDERERIFDGLFKRLDAAMADGRVEEVGATLSAMVSLAQKSPLEVLVDRNAFRSLLADKDYEWRL